MADESRTTLWKTGDQLVVECQGRTVSGAVKLASPNGVSLMLEFEAILAEHVGMMPVMRHDDGNYRSIVNGQVVTLRSRTDD